MPFEYPWRSTKSIFLKSIRLKPCWLLNHLFLIKLFENKLYHASFLFSFVVGKTLNNQNSVIVKVQGLKTVCKKFQNCHNTVLCHAEWKLIIFWWGEIKSKALNCKWHGFANNKIRLYCFVDGEGDGTLMIKTKIYTRLTLVCLFLIKLNSFLLITQRVGWSLWKSDGKWCDVVFVSNDAFFMYFRNMF